MTKYCILFCFAVCWGTNLYAQSDSTQISIGKKITIFSNVLNEKREIWISTPTYYSDNADTYPVLYLLDGESHFKHVSTAVEYLSSNLRIPQMIVVAITNTDRIRDLTPLHSLEGLDGKKDSVLFETTGGASNFIRFIREELVP